MDDKPSDRVRVVLERLAVVMAAPGVSVGDGLCRTGLDLLDVAGTGLSIHGKGGALLSVGVAGPDMAAIHELERTLGEGPCVEAYVGGAPTAERDLSEPDPMRWPAFGREVLRTSARAAFGYPLQVGAVRIGALNLYDTSPGDLTDEQHRNALALADVSAQILLRGFDAGAASPLDGVAGVADVARSQLEIFQATGMVSMQLGVSIDDALALLRARAFAEGRPIGELAADVTERRTRFDP